MFDLDEVELETVDHSSATLSALAALVLTLSENNTCHDVQAVNVEILRVHTGEPYRALNPYGVGQSAVTYDQFGPDALGNPVYAMPNYTGSVSEASSLMPDRSRLRLDLSEDRTTWTGIVTFEDARHSPLLLTMNDDQLPWLVTILGLRARAKLA